MHKPTMSPRALMAACFAVLIVAMILLGPILGLAGCTPQEIPAPVCAATKTATDAQADLAKILAYVDLAKAKVDASQALLDAITAAKDAIDAERYSDAVADLSNAVRILGELGKETGYEVPPEIPKRLAQAEVLLTMAGK